MSPSRRDQTKNGKILVVDDEPAERDGLARLVGQWGYDVETASSGEEALNLIETQHPAVVLTDLVLPEMDGLTLLQKLKETGRPPIVLLVTGHGTVDTAVEAMRHGAFDYLTKPVDATRLQALLEKSIEQESLSREVSFLRHQLRQKGSFGQLVGQSRSMQEVYRWIELAATSTAPVLIYGESGTGKELVARAIHERSARAARPFVPIHCGALPREVLESELFGHEKGAFTGAVGVKPGLIELADGGTLFLDEIGEMEQEVQVKLLRALETGTFYRVGGTRPRRVDVRVVAATNRDLAEAMRTGEFRQDLYYRINTITVAQPPLRERPDDVAMLARYFVETNVTYGRKHLGERALAVLESYAWPGNVRELLHAIERAVILAKGDEIEPGDLPPEVTGAGVIPGTAAGTSVSLEAIERQHIVNTLRQVGGHRGKAAALLEIDPKTLYRKILAYRIESHELRA